MFENVTPVPISSVREKMNCVRNSLAELESAMAELENQVARVSAMKDPIKFGPSSAVIAMLRDGAKLRAALINQLENRFESTATNRRHILRTTIGNLIKQERVSFNTESGELSLNKQAEDLMCV